MESQWMWNGEWFERKCWMRERAIESNIDFVLSLEPYEVQEK